MDNDHIKVTLLGTGMPPPTMRQFGMSTLVEAGEKTFLFDCGRGALQRLAQVEISTNAIDSLFLTHLHSDHLVGIPDLWLLGWVGGRESPFVVQGPEGTQEMMSHLEKAFQFDIRIRRDEVEELPAQGIEIVTTELGEGVVYDDGGVKVIAFLVDHGPVRPAFGYRIDYEGRSVVLSGDTTYSDNLIKHSQGTDLLVHEAIAPKARRARTGGANPERSRRIMSYHTTPEQAGEVFRHIKPKLAVFSHVPNAPGAADEIMTGTQGVYTGPVEMGEDLMTLDVGDRVQMQRLM